MGGPESPAPNTPVAAVAAGAWAVVTMCCRYVPSATAAPGDARASPPIRPMPASLLDLVAQACCPVTAPSQDLGWLQAGPDHQPPRLPQPYDHRHAAGKPGLQGGRAAGHLCERHPLPGRLRGSPSPANMANLLARIPCVLPPHEASVCNAGPVQGLTEGSVRLGLAGTWGLHTCIPILWPAPCSCSHHRQHPSHGLLSLPEHNAATPVPPPCAWTPRPDACHACEALRRHRSSGTEIRCSAGLRRGGRKQPPGPDHQVWGAAGSCRLPTAWRYASLDSCHSSEHTVFGP